MEKKQLSEKEELNKILIHLDNNCGRITKIRIMRILKNRKTNANHITNLLRLKSVSHVTKFLNFLYENYLVDYEIEESFNKEYTQFKIKKRNWFLTGLGYDLLFALKNISLEKELTPRMAKEKLKREIRGCKEFKEWREKVLIKYNQKCSNCGLGGDWLEAHHKKSFDEILIENKIETLEEAKNCAILFDVENGLCLCSQCHYDEHSKIRNLKNELEN